MKLFSVTLALLFYLAGIVFSVSASSEFEILAPLPGDKVSGSQVTVSFSLPSANPASRQGHIHLWIDEENPSPQNAIDVNSNTHVLSNLSSGNHSLTAELVSNQHKSLTPKTITSVSFEYLPSVKKNNTNIGFIKFSILFFFLVTGTLYLVDQKRKEYVTSPSKPKHINKRRHS